MVTCCMSVVSSRDTSDPNGRLNTPVPLLSSKCSHFVPPISVFSCEPLLQIYCCKKYTVSDALGFICQYVDLL